MTMRRMPGCRAACSTLKRRGDVVAERRGVGHQCRAPGSRRGARPRRRGRRGRRPSSSVDDLPEVGELGDHHAGAAAADPVERDDVMTGFLKAGDGGRPSFPLAPVTAIRMGSRLASWVFFVVVGFFCRRLRACCFVVVGFFDVDAVVVFALVVALVVVAALPAPAVVTLAPWLASSLLRWPASSSVLLWLLRRGLRFRRLGGAGRLGFWLVHRLRSGLRRRGRAWRRCGGGAASARSSTTRIASAEAPIEDGAADQTRHVARDERRARSDAIAW